MLRNILSCRLHLNQVSTLACLSFGLAFIATSSGYSQPSATGKAPVRQTPVATSRTPSREISVTEKFEPSIQIEPLFHRLEGRPSDVLPFSFKVEVANADAELEIIPVALRQELTGQIFHDEKAIQADLIRIISPTQLSVQANNTTKIEGVVRIPQGNARFHTLGLLVRDRGRGENLSPQQNPDGSLRTQAGIRFVTQYLLRLDLVVEGVRGEQGQQLALEDVQLVPFEGRPKLQTTISNPTDTAFEFEVRAKLRNAPSDNSFKPLRLTMPSRSTVEDETRYVGRILPKSRLRMEELLPEAIASGRYYADMELVFENHVANRKSVPLDVKAEDFQAQEVIIAQVGEGVQVSPAQIELSQVRGGTRRLTMLLKNGSRDKQTIQLKAIADNGGSRKIAVTLRSQTSTDRVADYGSMLVTAKSDAQDFNVTRKLPLAVILKKLPPTQLTLSPIRWDAEGAYPSFQATVRNEGDIHLPLQARLSIVDAQGRRLMIPAGFGKWLMPKSSTNLEFRIDQPLPPGEYQMKCELQQDGDPLSMTQVFSVGDLENSVSPTN
jgi:hypothetical protein